MEERSVVRWCRAAGTIMLASLVGVCDSAVSPAAPLAKHPGASAHATRLVESSAETRERDAYWFRQRSWPTGSIPAGALARARADWQNLSPKIPAALNQQLPNYQWTPIGPAPYEAGSYTPSFGTPSGRATSIAIDPANAQTIYLGTALGGVWKSTNGGTTWTATTDTQQTLAIGSVAVDPSNGTIYAGTGEANGSDAYYGMGVLTSTNGGTTWTLVGQASFDGVAIGKIVVDPSNGDVYAAAASGKAGVSDYCTGTNNQPSKYGLYKSANGGSSWTQLVGQVQVQDFAVDFTVTPRLIYFSSENGGGSVYNTGNATSTQIGTLPANASRIAFAQSPTTSTTWYAGVGLATNPPRGTLYYSTDSGAAWTQVAGTQPDYCGDQCDYDNAVIVDPVNAGTVYYGGSTCGVYKVTGATTGAPTFAAASIPGGDCGTKNANWATGYVHSDVHGFAFASGTLYVVEDGGVALTTNGGSTWSTPDAGLATIQFYHVCVEPGDVGKVYGGAQDNGTTAKQTNGLVWKEIFGGDGGACVANLTDPNANNQFLLFSTQNANVTRQDSGGTQTSVFDSGPSCTNSLPGCGDRSHFIAPLTADPSTPTTVYIGTYRLWRSTDGGSNWTALGTTDLTKGTAVSGLCTDPNVTQKDDVLSAISVARSDSKRLYVGSTLGALQVSKDTGANWAGIDKAPLPNRWVSGLTVNPTNADVVYAAFSGFSANTPSTPGHVFMSTNIGSTWTQIDASLSIDVPFNALIAHPLAPSLLYAATDTGVLVTWDDGQHWTPIGSGLPSVAVFSLAFHTGSSTLIAGTHGRSAWEIPMQATIASDPAALTFSATLGGADPPSQTVAIYDVDPGGSILAFTAVPPSGAAWVSATGAMSGKLAGTMTSSLTVAVSIASLPVGGYDAKITVTDPNATSHSYDIPIHLDVTSVLPDAGTDSGGGDAAADSPGGGGDDGGGDDGGGAANNNPPKTPAGCACRLQATAGSQDGAFAAVAMIAVALARRRSRR